MSEKQQHKQGCETCGHHTAKGSCMVATQAVMPIVKDVSHFSNGEGIYINQSERDLIGIIGCASHTSALTLTQALTAYYTERSSATGKPVQTLVLQDLAALHRKRVAKEEKRVWKENEFERL